MFGQPWQHQREQTREGLLLQNRTQKRAAVKTWHQLLHQRGKQPKTFLLGHVAQQQRADDVHALCVSHQRVARRVCAQYVAQRSNARVGLEQRVLTERAVEVLLNVHCGLRLHARDLAQQRAVRRLPFNHALMQ